MQKKKKNCMRRGKFSKKNVIKFVNFLIFDTALTVEIV